MNNKIEKIQKKFCTKCGLQLVAKPDGYFDENTGLEGLDYFCPSLMCDHKGIRHEYVSQGWFKPEVCSKCGQKYYNVYFVP